MAAETYYAVPTGYTIGSPYGTFAEAVDAAKATIRPFDGIPGWSRAFVDQRETSADGDRVVARFEVFSDGTLRRTK
jgi:hypothetical protein